MQCHHVESIRSQFDVICSLGYLFLNRGCFNDGVFVLIYLYYVYKETRSMFHHMPITAWVLNCIYTEIFFVCLLIVRFAEVMGIDVASQ